MKILAIDPGAEKSAWLIWDSETKRILETGIEDNTRVLLTCGYRELLADKLVVEMIASYGMPVGKEVFDTCVWIGRFIERFGENRSKNLIYRKDIKMHLCNSMRAKDSHIRQALIDKFGGKEKAIGVKKNQGVLYGIKADLWSALAVAVVYSETCKKEL